MNLFYHLKLKLPILSLSQFSLFLSIWLGMAINLSFYHKIKLLTPYTGLKSSAFVVATVLIVIAAYNLIMQLLQWRYTAKISTFIFVLLGGLSAYFVTSLGVVISPDQIQNAMQTDVQEATDLFSWQLVVWCIWSVILPLFLFMQLPIRQDKLQIQLKSKMLHITGSFVVVLALLFVFYIDYAAIFRENRDLKGMISPQNVIASSLSYYHKKAPKQNLPLVIYGEDAYQIKKVTQTAQPKLMVLVIGETARAESFALNGYARATNPQLSKQKIINFTQVSSCGTATAVSLPCMFSGMTRQNYDEALASHREGLLDLAQRAGYKVTWIENNSGCKGVCNRVEIYQIPEEIKRKWCNSEECYDEILVESLKAYILQLPKNDQTPRLVVLHQMGSHGPAYYKRSTAQYQPFQPTCESNAIQGCSAQQLLNSYDNSIVYTDHVLSQIIDVLKPIQHYQTGFWYLSDHGESTGEHGLYLHGAPYAIAPTQQTHIPMMMWFSDQWKAQAAQQVICLTQQQQKVLSQDNLFPTLLDLLDIQSQVINKNNDLLQTCATPQTRI